MSKGRCCKISRKSNYEEEHDNFQTVKKLVKTQVNTRTLKQKHIDMTIKFEPNICTLFCITKYENKCRIKNLTLVRRCFMLYQITSKKRHLPGIKRKQLRTEFLVSLQLYLIKVKITLISRRG